MERCFEGRTRCAGGHSSSVATIREATLQDDVGARRRRDEVERQDEGTLRRRPVEARLVIVQHAGHHRGVRESITVLRVRARAAQDPRLDEATQVEAQRAPRHVDAFPQLALRRRPKVDERDGDATKRPVAKRHDEVLLGRRQAVPREVTLVPAIRPDDDEAPLGELVQVVERRPERKRRAPCEVAQMRPGVRFDALEQATPRRDVQDLSTVPMHDY